MKNRLVKLLQNNSYLDVLSEEHWELAAEQLANGLEYDNNGARKLMEDAPIADVVPREEVAKIFEAIEINIFKLETPYQTLHCIPSGFIEELKEKYTKGGAKDE